MALSEGGIAFMKFSILRSSTGQSYGMMRSMALRSYGRTTYQASLQACTCRACQTKTAHGVRTRRLDAARPCYPRRSLDVVPLTMLIAAITRSSTTAVVAVEVGPKMLSQVALRGRSARSTLKRIDVLLLVSRQHYCGSRPLVVLLVSRERCLTFAVWPQQRNHGHLSYEETS